jgi:hypothetical protein
MAYNAKDSSYNQQQQWVPHGLTMDINQQAKTEEVTSMMIMLDPRDR